MRIWIRKHCFFPCKFADLRFSDWNTKEIMYQLMEAGGDVGGCITVHF
jgi:hypothetical protein